MYAYFRRILALADRWIALTWESPFTKACSTTFLMAVPLLLEIYEFRYRVATITCFFLAAFFFYWLVEFKPDVRFSTVRAPTLDAWFRHGFDSLKSNFQDKRFPIRVHIFKERGILPRPHIFNRWEDGWWNRLPVWHRLQEVYRYNVEKTDPDCGMVWFPKTGSCWKCLQNGKIDFFDTRSQDVSSYGLTDRERQATAEVKAILCLPIRTVRSNIGVITYRNRPDAVLSIDAMNDQAADFLYGASEDYQAGRMTPGTRTIQHMATMPELFFGGRE